MVKSNMFIVHKVVKKSFPNQAISGTILIFILNRYSYTEEIWQIYIWKVLVTSQIGIWMPVISDLCPEVEQSLKILKKKTIYGNLL